MRIIILGWLISLCLNTTICAENNPHRYLLKIYQKLSKKMLPKKTNRVHHICLSVALKLKDGREQQEIINSYLAKNQMCLETPTLKVYQDLENLVYCYSTNKIIVRRHSILGENIQELPILNKLQAALIKNAKVMELPVQINKRGQKIRRFQVIPNETSQIATEIKKMEIHINAQEKQISKINMQFTDTSIKDFASYQFHKYDYNYNGPVASDKVYNLFWDEHGKLKSDYEDFQVIQLTNSESKLQ